MPLIIYAPSAPFITPLANFVPPTESYSPSQDYLKKLGEDENVMSLDPLSGTLSPCSSKTSVLPLCSNLCWNYTSSKKLTNKLLYLFFSLQSPSFSFSSLASFSLQPPLALKGWTIRRETVPAELKNGRVTPLLKKPSLNPDDPASYRPISNLHVVVKIMEKMFCRNYRSFWKPSIYYILTNRDLEGNIALNQSYWT